MCKIYVNALFGWLFQVHRRHVVKRLHFPQQLLLSNPLHINRTLHDCMCVGKAKIYASILQASQNQKNNAGNCKSNSHWLCSVDSPGRNFKGREKTCALTERYFRCYFPSGISSQNRNRDNFKEGGPQTDFSGIAHQQCSANFRHKPKRDYGKIMTFSPRGSIVY